MGKRKDSGVSATTIAKIAKVSVQLVYRKLAQGKTASEIIVEAARWRERQQLAGGLDLPVVPIEGDVASATNGKNGHSKNGTWGNMTYAAAQTAKENALAELRQVELMEKRRELIPVVYVRHWGLTFLIEARNTLERGPSELRDELASLSDPIRCGEVMQKWVDRVIHHFYQLKTMWEPPYAGDDGRS
jgi:hypothetical protein